MAENTGNKVSLPEYTARAVINIAERALPPILTAASGYVVWFHGNDIANWIRNKTKKKG